MTDNFEVSYIREYFGVVLKTNSFASDAQNI